MVDKWLPEVSHFCPGVPLILVGTKKDLRTDPHVLRELSELKQKPVSSAEGQHVALQIKAHAYIECSARTRDSVRDVFWTAAMAALRKRWSPNSARCRLL